MWDLPGPGLEPVSPALAGGFLTTAPPGKPPLHIFKSVFVVVVIELYEFLYVFWILTPYQMHSL